MSTRSFNEKKIAHVRFEGKPPDTPEADFTGLDFSGFDLTGTHFARNLKGINLTNAVITSGDFSRATNLTLDQIKSTWNYKTGNMEGVILPKEIQEVLEAERQAKEELP